MQNTELPQYDALYSKLRSCNTLEAKNTGYVNLLKSGLTTEQAVVKLKPSKTLPYWEGELSIPASNLEAGTNELVPRLFAPVKQ